MGLPSGKLAETTGTISFWHLVTLFQSKPLGKLDASGDRDRSIRSKPNSSMISRSNFDM